MALALLYSREYLDRRGMMRGEYYVLALTALLGVFVIISANSLLTVYIGIELMSLSLYAMVAFDRENGTAAESAMKYFLLGAIASGILLYGMSLIYGLTGTIKLDDLASMATGDPSLGVILGLVFIVVQHLKTGIGEMRGDGRPHNPRAEYAHTLDLPHVVLPGESTPDRSAFEFGSAHSRMIFRRASTVGLPLT
jgi:formate hydrogenlyase subunit 3/multisubunit Na+/H+ antiporter MnhD subunit